MSSYLPFIKKHFRPIAFGGMLTYFSSLGQTFFISIFVPFVLKEFDLSKSAFGGYYAIATILASFGLIRFGKQLDYMSVKAFAYRVVFLLALSGLIFAFSLHPLMLFVAMIGLRMGGQGLLPHICFTTFSRYFDYNRGKAISISSMGFPLGEMTFPLLIGGIIAISNWRMGYVAGVIIMLISMVLALKKMHLDFLNPPENKGPKGKERNKSERKYIRAVAFKGKFWMIMLLIASISFVTTGLFFYQYVLANERGWPAELYSLLFAGFAISRLLFSLFGGWLTDRFSAKKVFPFYALPLVGGVIILASVPGIIGAALFLVLTGITMGLHGVLRTSVVAEVYGVERIGYLQSVSTFIVVISSALAPVIYGYCLDIGISFSTINWVVSFILIIITMNAFRLRGVEYAHQ